MSGPVQDETPDGDRNAWSISGPQTVSPGIHRIPLPLPLDGLRAVNVYAVEDGDSLVLIDGGWALDVARAVLERSLKELGHSLQQVRRVLVTHVHRDHYTQAIAIRRAVGARVALGAGEQDSIANLLQSRAGISTSQPTRLRRLGARSLADELEAVAVDMSETLAYYEEPDDWLEPGPVELDTVTLQAVHTPGHTRGHLVFHAADRGLLFAGDHILPHITPSIGFEPERPPFPLQDYIGSLERVLALPDAMLLPAHGPSGGRTHARARALIAHHERRLTDTLAALRSGAGLAPDVARALRWTSRGHALEELGLFDRMLAVLETAAHLDVLVLRGEAVRAEQDDTVTYALSTPDSDSGATITT
jgi:glyoxylase-like metal-dependent hydrolase (beta-lactamase superfamily II)